MRWHLASLISDLFVLHVVIYWVIYYCRYSFEGCQMPPNHQAIFIWWSSQGWHILCFTLVFGRFEATKLIGFLGQRTATTWLFVENHKASNVSGQKLHQDSWFICWSGFLVDWSCEWFRIEKWSKPMELRWERTAVSETQPWAMKLILHLDTKEITCYSVLTSLLEPLCVKRRRELLGDMLLHVVVAFSDCLTQISNVAGMS